MRVRGSTERTAICDLPELASDTKILATSHESVTLTSLGRGGYPGGVKIFLLSSGYTNQSTGESERRQSRYEEKGLTGQGIQVHTPC